MQNADYVEQRNALIPGAVAFANKKAGVNPTTNPERDAWNRAFHTKMNELARMFISNKDDTSTVRGRA